MGERRLRLASASLRSILSRHSFGPRLLQSSAISPHLENRVSLLQTIGSYLLSNQRIEVAEGRQVPIWIQPRLSSMGTVSAEVPVDLVLEKASELSTINGGKNVPLTAEEESAKETPELLTEKKTHENCNAQNASELSTINGGKNVPVKAEEESAKETPELLTEKKTHEDCDAQNIAKRSTFNEENTQVKLQDENANNELLTEKKMLEDNDIQNAIASLSLQAENGLMCEMKKLHVVFVLGGPGSGKGTQCAKIVDNFGFTHLSAGDLLRAEIKSGSENGTMIQNMIKEGKIVPSEVTVKLLQRAMQESENDKFLIDGFPRNEENRAAFENVTGIEPDFILFFDCPEEEMERRLLNRNEGRVDDNIETIRKRFKVFVESSLPVVGYYDVKGKVRKIDAARAKEDIFEHIKALFLPYIQEMRDVKTDNN